MDKNRSVQAFSLVEVLIFVAVVSILFVVVAAATAVALRNSKTSEHKILADRYTQELMEWLRTQKELDWNSFLQYANGNPYCFQTTPLNINTGWTQCVGPKTYTGLLPKIYDRRVTLSGIPGGPCQSTFCQVLVNVVVSWQEAGQLYTVPDNSIFAIWEQ